MSDSDSLKKRILKAYRKNLKDSSPDTSLSALREAYHTLMYEEGFHPDRGGNPNQAAQLNELYEELRQKLQKAPLSLDPETLLGEPPPAIKPLRPIEPQPTENYQKVTCSDCGATHTFFFQDHENLPHIMNCRTCSHILIPNERKNRIFRRENFNRTGEVTTSHHLDPVTVRILDFSPKGIRILSERPIESYETVYISAEDFKASGDAVWMRKKVDARKPSYEIGIRFESFTPQKSSTFHKSTI